MKRTKLITTLAASALITATTFGVPLQLNHQGRLLDNGVNIDGTGHFKFALLDYDQNLNRRATARATVAAGRVVSITVLDGGLGYVSVPNVRITPIGRGGGAAATARIGGGRVTSITVTSGGAGYLGAPLISLDAPTGPPTLPSIWSHDGTSTMGDEPTGSITLPIDNGLFSLALGDLGIGGMTEAFSAALLADSDDLRLRTWFSASGDPGTFELLSPDHKITSVPYAIRAEVAQTVPDGAIGLDQIADGAITGDKIANGTITNANISAPGNQQILVSDGNGNATWMTAAQFLLSQGYTPSLPGIVENLAVIEVSGIFTDTVQIVNGPGLQIEDLGGNPGESGLNTEFAIVFDYDGPDTQELQDWLDTPSNRSGSIIVNAAGGSEAFRWNFFEFQLTDITPGGGNNGKNRYTMTHTLVPNNTVSIARTNGAWPANVDKRDGDTRVEITGVTFDVWPSVVDDPVAKTLTMTFDYNEGGGIWQWVDQIAEFGTFNIGRKETSLIYEDNSGNELGRNNYFECFPIRYQHFTGFDINTKCKEQIVISYDFALNGDNGNDPLFVPPVVEYFPGTQNMEVPYDLDDNGLNALEIGGITGGVPPVGAEAAVILSGPGWEIERLAGFDGMGDPDDQAGNNREFPIIFEIGGPDLAAISQWKTDYEALLPNPSVVRAGSLIVYNSGDTEQYRWNIFEAFPFEITPLPSGRGRVTLYNTYPPNQHVAHLLDGGGGVWGNALQNNPATDLFVDIGGISQLYAEVSVDAAERTITLNYDFGEGGALYDWAKQTVESGADKRATTITDGTDTNYFGTFPILFQHVSGFEQDIKGKAKVILSYDTSAPAAP